MTVASFPARAWLHLAAAIILWTGRTLSLGQGCVTSRGSGGVSTCSLHHDADGQHVELRNFEALAGYRWFRSDRMFSGDEEDDNADPQVNESHFFDVSLRYYFNPRFSAAVTVPFVWHDRSQVVRRLNPARTVLGEFHTKASGLGDIRVEGDAWILDPMKPRKGNVLVGLGVVLPTGDKDAEDTFAIGGASLLPSAVQASVDPSIQPGSGGYGISVDLYAYREIVRRLNGFVAGAYTFTPQEEYSPKASSVIGYTTYSIGDSYNGRAGVEFLVWPRHSLWLSLAGRIEGVPEEDPIGDSGGFRRPGYAVSIEPGVNASWRGWTFGMSAPVALYRNRLQNTTEEAAGMPAAAAGFADYQLLFSLSKRF